MTDELAPSGSGRELQVLIDAQRRRHFDHRREVQPFIQDPLYVRGQAVAGLGNSLDDVPGWPLCALVAEAAPLDRDSTATPGPTAMALGDVGVQDGTVNEGHDVGAVPEPVHLAGKQAPRRCGLVRL